MLLGTLDVSLLNVRKSIERQKSDAAIQKKISLWNHSIADFKLINGGYYENS